MPTIENSLFIQVVLANRNVVGNSEYIATLMLCMCWCYQKCWGSVMCWEDCAAQGSSLYRHSSPSCIPLVTATCAETGWRLQFRLQASVQFASLCLPMANPNIFSKDLCSPISLYSSIWDAWETYALLYPPRKNQWTTAMPKLSQLLLKYLSGCKQLIWKLGCTTKWSGISRSISGGQGFHLVVELKGAKNDNGWGPCESSMSTQARQHTEEECSKRKDYSKGSKATHNITDVWEEECSSGRKGM